MKLRACSVLCRGDLDDEGDDGADLLARLLVLTSPPVVGDALKVVDELRAVAEDVDSLASDDLESLSVADVLDDFADGLLEVLETAGRHRVSDLLDAVGKLSESTADGADADALDAVEEVVPGSVEVSDDLVDVLSADRRIAHGATEALSDTADKRVDVSRSDLWAVHAVLVDEDSKDLTGVLTKSVVVVLLEARVEGLEELDKLTAVSKDVHDLVLDESLDVTAADLSNDAEDVLSGLDDAAVLEGSDELLDTISKLHETVGDLSDLDVADAVSDLLSTSLEISNKILDVLDAGLGVAHDDIKSIGKALEEGDGVGLAESTTSVSHGTHEMLVTGDPPVVVVTDTLSLHESLGVKCGGRDDENKKEERNGCCTHFREKNKKN